MAIGKDQSPALFSTQAAHVITTLRTRLADDLAFALHENLPRVRHFLVTSESVGTDGDSLHLTAHEYGALVFTYAYAADLVGPEDPASPAPRFAIASGKNSPKPKPSPRRHAGKETMDLRFALASRAASS